MATGVNAASPVTVLSASDKAGLDAFLRIPYLTHADDPTWVAPLLAMEKIRLSPKGPFAKQGEFQLFVAWRDGNPVGRISAQVNHRALEHRKDGAGHFGFFDCLDDAEAARALVDAAGAWLRARGCSKMVGPFNFSINEECGLQIEGFESPPSVFMTQSRPWMGALLEQAGLRKEVDLFAYRARTDKIGAAIEKILGRARKSPRVGVRAPDLSKIDEEAATYIDIFNDAWSDNWGFTPMTEVEVRKQLGGFWRFLRGHYGRIVMLDGKAVGMMGSLPNYNEAVIDYRGRLFPFNWARLLWRLATDRFRSGRVVVFGVRKSIHGTPMAAPVTTALIEAMLEEMQRKYEWFEISWVLDINVPMMRLCERICGAPAKRYRIYGGAL